MQHNMQEALNSRLDEQFELDYSGKLASDVYRIAGDEKWNRQ